ncbi:RDD family protein [Hydrogenimonas sp.]
MGRWRDVKQGKTEKIDTRKSRRKSDAKEEPLLADALCAPVTLRLKAFIVDTFMITMPLLYIVIYLVMGSREGFKEHMAQGWMIILALHMVVVLLFWYLKAQTPGMKAYDLHLVDPQTGKKPGFVKLLLRYVMLQTAILSIIGLFVPWLLKSRAGLHDLVSGSCIVWRPSKTR